MRCNMVSKALISIKGMENKINSTPLYQRGDVWKLEQKQLLIDSILKKYDIPKIYVRNTTNGQEIVDGKQRLKTLWDFMNNRFSLGDTIEEYNNMKYSELPDEVKEEFDSFNLHIVEIDATDEEIEELFLRYQNGTPLKAVERRNAISGKLKDFIKTMVEHPVFDIVAFKNNRMQYDEAIAQAILLEMNGPCDIKKQNIDELYEQYAKDGLPADIQNNVEETLNFIENAFPSDKKWKFKKSVFLSIYMLVSELLKKEDMSDKYLMFADFWKWFDNQKENYEQYMDAISKGTSGVDSLKTRKCILLSAWKEYKRLSEKEAAIKHVQQEAQMSA